MAFLTFFRTISVKIALRIERGPEPPGRHRLSLSPHAHYVHPDFPISLRFSRIPVVGSDTSRPGPRERHQAARTCPTGPVGLDCPFALTRSDSLRQPATV